MSVINIISSIGNNSSPYPLLVRDCGIEGPFKIGLTYSQNLKDSKEAANNAFRERFIDEYGTSAVWLGGIPLFGKLCDWGIKKLGYNPNINPKLFNENENSKQGMKINIKKFEKTAPKEVEEMKKALENRKVFEGLLAGKFAISTIIPIILMGVAIPKLNFALTDKINEKRKLKKQEEKAIEEKKETEGTNPSFKGLASTLANTTTLEKMAVTDAGLTVGRVATGRNRNEKLELGFKMIMMMFLNFVAPFGIAKFFDTISGKLFGTNVDLDVKLLDNKEFLNAIKNNTLEMPEENIIEYLDKNPKSQFSKLASQYCDVKYLDNGVRDPRCYVDEKKIKKFINEIKKFSKDALNNKNVDEFSKKAIKIKTFNILANITVSSLLLAVGLPKLIFVLRKKVTGSDVEPGLVNIVHDEAA